MAFERRLSETGTVVYLPAERVREAELVWLDRTGNVTPVPGGRGPFETVTLSPDGRQAAGVLVEGTKLSLWTFDLERGSRRLLVSDARCSAPIFSRDGTFVTYQSSRGGATALCRKRADGTGDDERVVERGPGWPSPEDWSPDGKSLLFTESTLRGTATSGSTPAARRLRSLRAPSVRQSRGSPPTAGSSPSKRTMAG